MNINKYMKNMDGCIINHILCPYCGDNNFKYPVQLKYHILGVQPYYKNYNGNVPKVKACKYKYNDRNLAWNKINTKPWKEGEGTNKGISLSLHPRCGKCEGDFSYFPPKKQKKNGKMVEPHHFRCPLAKKKKKELKDLIVKGADWMDIRLAYKDLWNNGSEILNDLNFNHLKGIKYILAPVYRNKNKYNSKIENSFGKGISAMGNPKNTQRMIIIMRKAIRGYYKFLIKPENLFHLNEFLKLHRIIKKNVININKKINDLINNLIVLLFKTEFSNPILDIVKAYKKNLININSMNKRKIEIKEWWESDNLDKVRIGDEVTNEIVAKIQTNEGGKLYNKYFQEIGSYNEWRDDFDQIPECYKTDYIVVEPNSRVPIEEYHISKYYCIRHNLEPKTYRNWKWYNDTDQFKITNDIQIV